MKNSRLGTYGIVEIVVILLTKYLALTAIPSYYKIYAFIVLPAVSCFPRV